MKFLSILFFLLLISQKVICDYFPGYILANNSDTIYGFIQELKDNEYSQHCFFRNDSSESFKEYFPGDIKGFRIIDGKYFISSVIEINNKSKKVFLEYLIKGAANMFAYNSLKDIKYFIQLNDSTKYELKNSIEVRESEAEVKRIFNKREYIGILNICFQDAPPVLKKVKTLDLNRNSLISISKDYHNYTCPDSSCIIFESNKWNPLITIGFSTFYDLTYIHARSYDINIENNSSIGFGLNFKIQNIPLVNKNLDFQTKLFYHKQVFKYVDDKLPTFDPTISTDLYELKVLKIPVNFNYRLTSTKFYPSIGCGVTFNYRKANVTGNDYLVDQTINGSWSRHTIFNLLNFGWNVQCSIVYELTSEFNLEYILYYERSKKFFGGFPGDDTLVNEFINSLTLSYKI